MKKMDTPLKTKTKHVAYLNNLCEKHKSTPRKKTFKIVNQSHAN